MVAAPALTRLPALADITNNFEQGTITPAQEGAATTTTTINANIPAAPTPVRVVRPASSPFIIQGIAASMHAPRNRQPSPPAIMTEQGLRESERPADGDETRNRYAVLGTMSPAAVEELVRPQNSRDSKGKVRTARLPHQIKSGPLTSSLPHRHALRNAAAPHLRPPRRVSRLRRSD